MIDKEIQHLHWRAGYGITPDALQKARGKSKETLVDELMEQAKIVKFLIPKNTNNASVSQGMAKKDLSAEQKAQMKQNQVQNVEGQTLEWLDWIFSGPSPFHEKMTFFWMDHLACHPRFFEEGIEYVNAIKKYALQDFGSLLRAVSKTEAMMRFLSTMNNRVGAPNENFARELLELFTLGIGHYTEKDIQEAARAFTGWSYHQKQQQFQFLPNRHDPGEKVFLGKRGNFKGDDIIDIVLQQKQTALFLTTKIYRYFVNPLHVDQEQVNQWAEIFFKSGYRIDTLMREIFLSDHFYQKKNIGVMIKSPLDLLAGVSRVMKVKYENNHPLLFALNFMRQQPGAPPSVNGWPTQREWIDQTSLLFRSALAYHVLNSGELQGTEKPDDDNDPNMMKKMENMDKSGKRLGRITSVIAWDEFAKFFTAKTDADLREQLCDFLLQTGRPAIDLDRLALNGLNQTEKVKRITLSITATPEYQLC